jgi:hypothetical protein
MMHAIDSDLRFFSHEAMTDVTAGSSEEAETEVRRTPECAIPPRRRTAVECFVEGREG